MMILGKLRLTGTLIEGSIGLKHRESAKGKDRARRVSVEAKMSIEIEVLNGDVSWPLARPLYDTVWPPDVLAALPWAGIVFAHAELRVLVLDEAGKARCHVGVYRREITWNGRKMPVGGIGGVMTRTSMPASRIRQHRARGGDPDPEGRRLGRLRAAVLRTAQCALLSGARLEAVRRRDPCRAARGACSFHAIDPYVHDLRGRSPKDGVIDFAACPGDAIAIPWMKIRLSANRLYGIAEICFVVDRYVSSFGKLPMASGSRLFN